MANPYQCMACRLCKTVRKELKRGVREERVDIR